mmetsp:Transcript_24728/g.62174  ORF Transcript_24728/g.62174 Transcript_24728/m.62174 type:complete len:360 (-) Transcript_24728:2004-3083(-)
MAADRVLLLAVIVLLALMLLSLISALPRSRTAVAFSALFPPLPPLICGCSALLIVLPRTSLLPRREASAVLRKRRSRGRQHAEFSAGLRIRQLRAQLAHGQKRGGLPASRPDLDDLGLLPRRQRPLLGYLLLRSTVLGGLHLHALALDDVLLDGKDRRHDVFVFELDESEALVPLDVDVAQRAEALEVGLDGGHRDDADSAHKDLVRGLAAVGIPHPPILLHAAVLQPGEEPPQQLFLLLRGVAHAARLRGRVVDPSRADLGVQLLAQLHELHQLLDRLLGDHQRANRLPERNPRGVQLLGVAGKHLDLLVGAHAPARGRHRRRGGGRGLRGQQRLAVEVLVQILIVTLARSRSGRSTR